MGQRVFNFISILLLISCTTVDYQEIEVVKNKIIIPQKNTAQIETLENKTQEPTSYPIKSVTSGSISTFLMVESDIWIGKLGGEILRYNLYTGDLKKFADNIYTIKDYSIKEFLEYDESIIALQSERITVIDKNNYSVSLINLPMDITRATDMIFWKGKLYISTLGFGIIVYNLSTGVYSNIAIDLEFISSLAVKDNHLYIGSKDNGLYIFDLVEDKMKSRLKFPPGLFRKNITSIKLYDNKVWMGTADNGVVIWDLKSDKLTRFLREEGISSLDVIDNKLLVSIINRGVLIKVDEEWYEFSIANGLITNNITTVSLFNNILISGNIKKGLILQELPVFND